MHSKFELFVKIIHFLWEKNYFQQAIYKELAYKI